MSENLLFREVRAFQGGPLAAPISWIRGLPTPVWRRGSLCWGDDVVVLLGRSGLPGFTCLHLKRRAWCRSASGLPWFARSGIWVLRVVSWLPQAVGLACRDPAAERILPPATGWRTNAKAAIT